MKLLTTYTPRAERVAFTFGTVLMMAAALLVHQARVIRAKGFEDAPA